MNDEQGIRDTISTWIEATRKGNIETVLSLMTNDVVFLIAGQEPMIGKETFATAQYQMKEMGVSLEVKSTIKEISVQADWGWVWAFLEVRASLPGGQLLADRKGQTLSIFRKEHGRWLLARDANLLSSEQSPG